MMARDDKRAPGQPGHRRCDQRWLEQMRVDDVDSLGLDNLAQLARGLDNLATRWTIERKAFDPAPFQVLDEIAARSEGQRQILDLATVCVVSQVVQIIILRLNIG